MPLLYCIVLGVRDGTHFPRSLLPLLLFNRFPLSKFVLGYGMMWHETRAANSVKKQTLLRTRSLLVLTPTCITIRLRAPSRLVPLSFPLPPVNHLLLCSKTNGRFTTCRLSARVAPPLDAASYSYTPAHAYEQSTLYPWNPLAHTIQYRHPTPSAPLRTTVVDGRTCNTPLKWITTPCPPPAVSIGHEKESSQRTGQVDVGMPADGRRWCVSCLHLMHRRHISFAGLRERAAPARTSASRGKASCVP